MGAGRTVVGQGQPNLRIHAVESGVALASIRSAAGRQAIVGVAGPGNLLGADALLRDRRDDRSSVEITALTAARMISVPASELLAAMERDAAMGAWMAAALAWHVADAERRLSSVLALPVRARVLEALEWLADRFGEGRAADGWRTMALRITQEQLASLCGATRESVNRAIQALGREGVVSRRRGCYWIVASGGAGRSEGPSS